MKSRIFAAVLLALPAMPAPAAQPLLLQSNQGEHRTRMPRPGLNVKRLPDFIIKVDPKNGGSSDLVMLTEELRPGAVIPWHRHLDQDEIVYTENGRIFARVGDRSASLGPHATIFIPRKMWVTIRNNGPATVRLVAIFNRTGFEQFLRCISVPSGQPVRALTQAQLNACYRLGDAEHR
jgi:quercetin dioxygenase-like cupin family protein